LGTCKAIIQPRIACAYLYFIASHLLAAERFGVPPVSDLADQGITAASTQILEPRTEKRETRALHKDGTTLHPALWSSFLDSLGTQNMCKGGGENEC
jgi:hypothetical protein